MKNIKLVIAEDHEFFRRGLVETINDLVGFSVIGEVSNGEELIEFMKNASPDIVITDIKMPKLNGIEATQKLLAIQPDLIVLAISLHGEEEYLEKMIEIGVRGFLLKNTNSEILEKALQAVSEGKQYFSEEFIPYFTKKYISKNKFDDNEKLTKRELEVLQLIADGFTNQEIADKLFISAKTVMNHRTKIIEKTESKNTASLLAYAFKNKLIKI